MSPTQENDTLLTQYNYTIWRARTTGALCKKKVMGANETDYMKKNGTDEEDGKIIEARGIILTTISDELIQLVASEKIPYEMWKIIEQHFENTNPLRASMYRNELENFEWLTDITISYSEFIRTRLNTKDVEVPKSLSINYVIMFLRRMPLVYGDKNSWIRETTITLNERLVVLMTVEQELKITGKFKTQSKNSAFYANGKDKKKKKDKKNVKCYNCGKMGHFKRDCYMSKKEEANLVTNGISFMAIGRNVRIT